MQNDAGQSILFKEKDVDMYWRGRTYIEAGRIAHERGDNSFKMFFEECKPYWEQAQAIIEPIRAAHTGDLPPAVFEEGHILEPKYVVLLALMLDSEKGMSEQGKQALKKLSKLERDKRIVLVMNWMGSDLAKHLAEEAGFEVIDSGLIRIAEEAYSKEGAAHFDFETGPVESTRRMDDSVRQMRNAHNHRGKHGTNHRVNVRPQRQNFKGRGR